MKVYAKFGKKLMPIRERWVDSPDGKTTKKRLFVMRGKRRMYGRLRVCPVCWTLFFRYDAHSDRLKYKEKFDSCKCAHSAEV